MDVKVKAKQQKKEVKKLSPDIVQSNLLVPRRTIKAFRSLADIKKAFSLPINCSGVSDENRLAMDGAFESVGGFDSIYRSLTQHAQEMGQYPLTSFIGYGALQQIAQQGLIRACIQTTSDDMTRKWIELEGGDDTDSDKLNHLKDLIDNKYHLREVFHKAFTTTGYMGGAFVYVKTEDAKTNLPLSFSELSAELQQGKTLKFIVVDPVNTSPIAYNCTNPLEDDYMRPNRWWVLGNEVHASRMLSLVDNEPPTLLKPCYNFLGIPQAQILWDYVCHFNECRVNAANLLNKVSLLVVQTDMDAILSDPNGVAELDAKMNAIARYRNNDSVFVCDKESEGVSNVQTTLAGCTDVVRQALEMVAAINRTPAVKLLGISPSGFNATGESDIRNYYDYIHSKQELHHDAIQKCIEAIQLVEYGFIDSSIGFNFVDLNVENEQQKALTAQTAINSLVQLLDRQVMSAEEARQAVKQDPNLNLSFLSDEMPEFEESIDDFQTDDPDSSNLFEKLREQQTNGEES